MTDPVASSPSARADELAELLGHMTTRWDDERRLLARQLHDSLGSSMTALTMHLGLLAQKLPPEPALQDRAAQMKQLLINIINTNRDMQLSLWNDKLEFLGVKAAIAEAVSTFGEERGIKARASLPEDDARYTPQQNVALLRCAEEGLHNAASHAAATQIDVILDDDGDQLMLTVRDNGAGPVGAGIETPGRHGLRMLRERARHLGGTLALAAGPDGGAMLTMTLPLP